MPFVANSASADDGFIVRTVLFENQFAFVRFYDGRNGTQRYIHQSYPMGVQNLAEIFKEIEDFESYDAYFLEVNEYEE